MDIKITVDAHLVRFNEIKNCDLTDEESANVKNIYYVYIFNKNSVTHCCELAPSYELVWVYTDVEYNDEFRDQLHSDNSEFAEIWRDRFEESLIENEYVRYVHCSDIESIIENSPSDHIQCSDPSISYDDDTNEEVFERIREHYSCNWML